MVTVPVHLLGFLESMSFVLFVCTTGNRSCESKLNWNWKETGVQKNGELKKSKTAWVRIEDGCEAAAGRDVYLPNSCLPRHARPRVPRARAYDLAPAREEARMAVTCVCRRREFGSPLQPAVAFN